MSLRRLLLIDNDMGTTTVNTLVDCTQPSVDVVQMRFSDLADCCAVMSGRVADGQVYSYVGLVTHHENLAQTTHIVTDQTFIGALGRLFPTATQQATHCFGPCALDIFACDLKETDVVVQVLSSALDVPIYFSTNITGSGDGQDWLMEGKMVKGVMERVGASARNISLIYLDANRAAKSGLAFGWWEYLLKAVVKSTVDAIVATRQPGPFIW
jgi:hypothetical protein